MVGVMAIAAPITTRLGCCHAIPDQVAHKWQIFDCIESNAINEYNEVVTEFKE